jgi:hypothetical protein
MTKNLRFGLVPFCVMIAFAVMNSARGQVVGPYTFAFNTLLLFLGGMGFVVIGVVGLIQQNSLREKPRRQSEEWDE